MSESHERDRIRERKRRELEARLDGSADAGGDDPSPDEPIVIRDEDHFASIIERYPVVLVDCHAEWCGPCKMLEPTVTGLAAQTDAAVAKVDVDRHHGLAQRLGVRGVPTLLIYANGEIATRFVGVQDEETLASAIEDHRSATG